MLPRMPTEVGLPSVNARAGLWQLAQATVPSADKRPSKKSFCPRATFSGVCGLSGGIAACVRSTGRPACRGDLGWANEPTFGIGGCAAVFVEVLAAPTQMIIISPVTPAQT